MNVTIHNILLELENQLAHASIGEALALTSQSIEQITGYMRLYAFRSRAEEVLYFKVFKPRFMAHRLCAERVMKESAESLWEERTVEQQSFYAYYTSGQSHRDSFYFTCRQCKMLDFDMPELAANNWQAYDKWVARILAQEWSVKKMSY